MGGDGSAAGQRAAAGAMLMGAEQVIVIDRLPERLAEELVRIIGVLRGMQLKKVPSVAETIDWGRTVLALGFDTIDDEMIAATLGVVLKHQSDQVKASGELRLN